MRPAALLLPLAFCAALSACKKPEPPKNEPPKPRADAAETAPAAPQASELREAIQKPIDKANAAQDATAAAEQKRDAALDAATGQ